ncbi:Bifunctional adenosylcobalamin biosynthesis protein CobP [wastewater metagenome]|uniref:Adenosylcobinamide kinase n=2 Tax=unclassified sequences TaxID=12908 RepID=A0A5B8R902_9ZZZZ|nr:MULTISPECIES: bifunctional adenosylcobinamide kinase/adenosylcobinamide-phosphate guanylyltransferase [Arhodomonas]MCS4505269.1 bifunctional adenosylcobinamide kinase/adenosylcobinamide-phosphate guanylyltransferase [Arhodomonas aquaeolei]QEA05011.1 bifunctional adenosylcobalamin biosynthesis protein CobP [uncultured organism]
MRELVLGGVKSGKSRYAESRAAETADVVYVATACAGDDAMAERIRRHRDRRPVHWRTRETDMDLAGVLAGEAAPGRCLLVDCLTLWLTRFLEQPDAWPDARTDLLDALPGLPGRVLMVSNDVGGGVIPADAVSRWFVDEAGRLHQAVAERCERVALVTAGLPQILKDER